MTLILKDIEEDIQHAAELLRQGELVAFPTETVYGIGAPIFHDSVSKIFSVKKRPRDNPLIAHISNLDQVAAIAQNISLTFYQLAEKFFPGPLTIILQKAEEVPLTATAGLKTIGIRMPNHPVALKLIDYLKVPIVAPSANLSGLPSSTRVEHVLHDFRGVIAAVLDGGHCQHGLESTVILLEPELKILRPGAITKEALEDFLQAKISYASNSVVQPLAPGMKYKHYAPHSKVRLFHSKKDLNLFLTKAPSCKRAILSKVSPQELYDVFRQSDLLEFEEIIILCDSFMHQDAALMNRLLKAAQGD